MPRTTWYWFAHHPLLWRRCTIGALIGLIWLLILPIAPVYADSPFSNPDDRLPQGGGSGSIPTPPSATTSTIIAIPDGYREVPPPLSMATRGAGAPAGIAPQQSQPATGMNPLAWIAATFNPGKWLMDSVMGSTAGIIASITSVFEVIGRFGMGQVVDINGNISSISDSAYGFLFTTPEDATIGWSFSDWPASTQSLHTIVRRSAISILGVIVVYRAMMLLAEGSSYREGLFDLFVTSFGAVLGIQAAWWFCTLLIRSANAVANVVLTTAFPGGLSNWDLFDPARLWFSNYSTPGLNLIYYLVLLIYWIVLALLTVHALARIVMVNLMIIASPLAGLALASGGSWNYARVWFFRMVEYLSTPIIWAITIAFGRALVNMFGVGQHPIIAPILAVFTFLMVFKAPQIIGVAAHEAMVAARAYFAVRNTKTMIGGTVAATKYVTNYARTTAQTLRNVAYWKEIEQLKQPSGSHSSSSSPTSKR